MSEVVLDTNVLLDLASAARPCHGDAIAALTACAEGGVRALAPASSWKDVYFIFARRYGTETEAREAVCVLRRSVGTVDVTDDIVERALFSDEPDFEDGIVRAIAEDAGADWIVTRDAAAFEHSAVRSIAPARLAERLSG